MNDRLTVAMGDAHKSCADARMRTLTKYVLFQLPQWLALALFLWFLFDRSAVPGWAAASFFIFWMIKDFAVYPFVRCAYEAESKIGSEQLIGRKGVARESLAPEGYIKIQGELWKARCENEPVSQDQTVHVTGARGMTLLVRPESKHLKQSALP